jgi:hypothetical protein
MYEATTTRLWVRTKTYENGDEAPADADCGAATFDPATILRASSAVVRWRATRQLPR